MRKKTEKKSFSQKTFKEKLMHLYHDTSPLILFVKVLLLLLILKFLIYPLFVAVTGTELAATVIDGFSMEHRTHFICLNYSDGVCVGEPDYSICGNILGEKKTLNFDDYWNLCGDYYSRFNITKNDFEKFPFKNGIYVGDIVFFRTTQPEDVNLGDVVVLKRKDTGKNIIHRTIMKKCDNACFYYSKGDNNIKIDGKPAHENNLHGKVVMRIPFAGYIRLWLLELAE